MPELLLELFSEEIPARMQAQAGRDLARMATERLAAAGLAFERMQAFAGPRRLTLVVEGLPAAQADRPEERKGPKANAPEQAVAGFLRSTGLTREQLTERDGVLYASLARPGRPTPKIVAEMVEAIVRGFPWPKSMRWGGPKPLNFVGDNGGAIQFVSDNGKPITFVASPLRWVRPLQRILCLFDGAVVPFAIDGIAAGDLTEGHRFMGRLHRPIKVTHFDQYKAALFDHFVILDQIDRKRIILDGARAVCAAHSLSNGGLGLIEDEGLLDEVSGLAEWPVPVLGDMDPAFLDLPPEVIRTSMRTHQKYFAVRRPGEAGLAPHFVVVANIAAEDGGAALAAGNAKVLAARLSDARFFWNEDRKVPLEDRLEKLRGVTFHAKLGTMYERVERIEALAREIAPLVGADPDLASKAARLAKADLGTGMVGEFPELQGIMGGYYARLEGRVASFETPTSPVPQDDETGHAPTNDRHAEEVASAAVSKHARWFDGLTSAKVDQVADAVRDHYKPVGPSDTVPTAPVTVAVALADKLDTLIGFWYVGEKPTGSKDPYALRRAALGLENIILKSKLRLPLNSVAILHGRRVMAALLRRGASGIENLVTAVESFGFDVQPNTDKGVGDNPRKAVKAFENSDLRAVPPVEWERKYVRDLGLFLLDRLKVLLRDEGKRHDLVDAVFALGDDDLVRITARVEALSAFLATEDGANLLAGYKRATNILKAEEKKHPAEAELYRLNAELSAAALPEEAALQAALRTEVGRVDEALAAEDFTGAMRHLAHLRTPVDAFFDKVLVNDPDPQVRLNRLRLLTQVRDTANRVADFSLISG